MFYIGIQQDTQKLFVQKQKQVLFMTREQRKLSLNKYEVWGEKGGTGMVQTM